MSPAARPIGSAPITPGDDARARLRRFIETAAADEWKITLRDGDVTGRHPSGAGFQWPLRLLDDKAVDRLRFLMARGVGLALAAQASACEPEP